MHLPTLPKVTSVEMAAVQNFQGVLGEENLPPTSYIAKIASVALEHILNRSLPWFLVFSTSISSLAFVDNLNAMDCLVLLLCDEHFPMNTHYPRPHGEWGHRGEINTWWVKTLYLESSMPQCTVASVSSCNHSLSGVIQKVPPAFPWQTKVGGRDAVKDC